MPTYLVTSATGKQGSGTVHALLAQANTTVHALTRDPNSAASRALATAGVKLSQGSFSDQAALAAAVAGCDGVFMNVSPRPDSMTGELEDARRILAAAKGAGTVKHVVYTSVIQIDQSEAFIAEAESGSMMEAYWTNKTTIEREVREGGFEFWTLLRPSTFLTNWLMPTVAYMFPALGSEGLLRVAVKPGLKIYVLDPADVGKFAAAAFADPARFHGQAIEIAAEAVTFDDIAAALSKATGKHVAVKPWTAEECEARKDDRFMQTQRLWNKYDWSVDLDQTKKWGIDIIGLDEFLRQHKEIAETIGPK